MRCCPEEAILVQIMRRCSRFGETVRKHQKRSNPRHRLLTNKLCPGHSRWDFVRQNRARIMVSLVTLIACAFPSPDQCRHGHLIPRTVFHRHSKTLGHASQGSNVSKLSLLADWRGHDRLCCLRARAVRRVQRWRRRTWNVISTAKRFEDHPLGLRQYGG